MIYHTPTELFTRVICHWIRPAALLIVGLWAGVACRSAQKLYLQTLPNYTANQPTIIFLDFEFESTPQPHKSNVTLANAIAGRGQMKTIEPFSNSNRQVEIVFRNSSDEAIRAVQYDHPLYRIVEYPTEGKSFRVRGLSLGKSNLSIRFARQSNLVALDMYSLIDNKRRKLYTLQFIP